MKVNAENSRVGTLTLWQRKYVSGFLVLVDISFIITIIAFPSHLTSSPLPPSLIHYTYIKRKLGETSSSWWWRCLLQPFPSTARLRTIVSQHQLLPLHHRWINKTATTNMKQQFKKYMSVNLKCCLARRKTECIQKHL